MQNVYSILESQTVGILLHCAIWRPSLPWGRQLHNDLLPLRHWWVSEGWLRPCLAHHWLADTTAVKSEPKFRLPPSLTHLPPSTPLCLLPDYPSGNHELQGSQTLILRFQMFGKSLGLGHCSGVRGFGLDGLGGGQIVKILSQKRKIRCGVDPLFVSLAPKTTHIAPEKYFYFPWEVTIENKISAHENILLLLCYKHN